MDKHEYYTLVEAGIYPPENLERKALDTVGGFMVMLEAVINGNKRWTIYDIIHDWCITSFQEDIEDEPDFYNHTIAKLIIYLIMKGHNNFKVAPPRKFIAIYKYVMADSWWDETNRKVRKLVYEVSDMFNITPYQYTNNNSQ